MHWCQDETLAAMSAVPVVGILFKKVHKWYHKSTHHKCHHAGCESDHLDHVEEALMPNPPARDVLTVEQVDSYFGQLATIILMHDRKLLGTREFPPHNEFVFFISPEEDILTARWKNKFFIWDGKDWSLDPEYLPKPVPRTDLASPQIHTVETVMDVLRSIQRVSVGGGYLETWFDEDEYGSSITSFIPGSFTRELLELIENHLLGYHEQNTGTSNQGLGQEQKANSGPTQSNKETT